VLAREDTQQKFRSIEPSWRKYIKGGIYIPFIAQQQLLTLKINGPEVFLAELERLASLGSPWASALLALQALLLRPDGTRDLGRAIELCKGPAARGDAYAQYILGWATFLNGDHLEAGSHFKSSAIQLFPPAVLDSVTFFWLSHRLSRPEGVLTSLQHAKAVGHFATPLWRSKIYRSGRLGMGRLLLGYLIAPVAILRHLICRWRNPFSARVFVFDTRAKSSSLFFCATNLP
jgi:hypothetical protein